MQIMYIAIYLVAILLTWHVQGVSAVSPPVVRYSTDG